MAEMENAAADMALATAETDLVMAGTGEMEQHDKGVALQRLQPLAHAEGAGGAGAGVQLSHFVHHAGNQEVHPGGKQMQDSMMPEIAGQALQLA